MTWAGPAAPPRRGRLDDLRIRDLGVIDDAVVRLADGFNVLTGETGAGKTMVVSGLGLLLGARAEGGLTRLDATAAVVEGSVLLPPGHPALTRAAEAGADIEDGLLLARSVGADGRSKAYVGGRQVPVSVLGEIGRLLVAVHGQADQWRLRRPDQHRSLLDAFGGPVVRTAAERYRAAYDEWARLRAELTGLEALDRDRLVQAAVLRAGLEELEALDPTSGEDESLAAEEERLAYADALQEAAVRAHTLLAGTDAGFGTGTDAGAGAFELLTQAKAALTQAAGHDPRLEPMAERAAELAYLAADLGSELAGYVDGVEGDPNRLSWVQQRRADLSRFTRRYGGSVDAALAWGADAALRLDRLASVADRIEEHRARLAALTGELAAAAADLSRARTDAAGRLAEAITAELAQLAMPQAVVEVDVAGSPAPEGEPGLVLPGRDRSVDAAGSAGRGVRFGPHGVDDVEIRLAANPGTAPRTVAKAASGGELSRVMLAIEVVTHLAGTAGTAETAAEGAEILTTFVFDEVDAGVGGAAALAIGARLAALARHTQVVVVTHLAQVAAYADRHITIRKSVGTSGGQASVCSGAGGAAGPEVTTSDLTVLDEDGRLRELARMMAGSADSDVAIEHARELLTAARADTRGAAGPGTAIPHS